MFPFAEIDGCYFHFTKNLWKQVAEFGLIVGYRNNENLKTVIRKIMALGFLPLLFITGAFHVLSTSVLVAQLMREYPNLVHFFNTFGIHISLQIAIFYPTSGINGNEGWTREQQISSKVFIIN